MTKTSGKTSKEDRLKIAAQIVELSDQVLSKKVNLSHIALKIGSGPNSVAAVVSNSDRVSFFIRSTDLLNRAKAEGFNPIEAELTSPKNEHRFRFYCLSPANIEAHEGLFREIVQESMRTIMDRRPKN